MREQVKKIFTEFFNRKFSEHKEVLRLLLNHERLDVAIDKACEEVQKAERKRFSINWDAEKYRYFVEECAKLFAHRALDYAEQQLKSEQEKSRLKQQNERYDDAQEAMYEIQKDETKRLEKPRIFTGEGIKGAPRWKPGT